jgi:hypothetical protein
MLKRTFAACMLLLAAAGPLAAQTLVVEGVLSPAWVERAGKREPLANGMALAAGDKVHTGPGSRALLRMAEGSAVKLGENATLAVDELLQKKDGGKSLVNASFDVVRGAFRFTTGVFSKAPAERDVKVKISTVTAGIRGTDVWGRSTAQEDIVCLIDGRIAVEHGGRQFAMAEPLLFFIAPRNQPPRPVATVDRKQVDQWAAETEIRDGDGANRRGGRYRVALLATSDGAAAQQTRSRARDAGFPAEVESTRDRGSYGSENHQVLVTGFASAKDAAAAAARLRALGFAGAQAN